MKDVLIRREALSASDEEAMWLLFARHFEGVTREGFRADLDGKNWVLLLRDEWNGALRGFTTIHLYDIVFEGRSVSVVYSGDTIVERAAWDASALARGWAGSIGLLLRERAGRPLYWLLLVSGFRTYRFLPVCFKAFFPRHDVPTPPEVRRMLDRLAEERFGSLYSREEGIVRFPRPQILCEGLRTIPPGRLADPHVAFFTSQNPGHEGGDELVCLAEVSRANLSRAGLRMWDAGERALAQRMQAR